MLHRHTPVHARPKMSRKKRWLLTAGIVPLLIGGAAFAYFDLNQATSHVSVAATPSFTINISQPTGDDLSPGSGSQTVTFQAVNQLNKPQTINSITYAVTTDLAGGTFDTSTGAFNDQCLVAWFSIVGSPSVPPPTVVSPNGTLSGTVVVSMPENDVTDQDACEGTSPQISVTLN